MDLEERTACRPPSSEHYGGAPNLRRADASSYLAEFWGIAVRPQTLAKYACHGDGPRFFKAGLAVLYPRDELDRWAKERLGALRSNTSERAA